jgi:hypothetical protein
MIRTGAERTDVAVLWPSRLLRPQHTRLVYLDLNQWIGLAKAAVGHRDGKRFSRRWKQSFLTATGGPM